MARDDFDKETKEILARRVGYRCSNPNCRQSTSGPQINPNKAISIGVAAHISAASVGGPRYDATLTSQERKSPENGIWLCQNCAKLIDNDEYRYPTRVLLTWKDKAEEAALIEIEERKVLSTVSSGSHSYVNNYHYVENHQHFYNSPTPKKTQKRSRNPVSQRASKLDAIESHLANSFIKVIRKGFWPVTALVCLPTCLFILGIFITGEPISLIISSLIPIAVGMILYCIFYSTFYSRIRISGFYTLLTKDERLRLKRTLQHQRWEHIVVDWYMYCVIEVMLLIDKREAEKVLKLIYSWW